MHISLTLRSIWAKPEPTQSVIYFLSLFCLYDNSVAKNKKQTKQKPTENVHIHLKYPTNFFL